VCCSVFGGHLTEWRVLQELLTGGNFAEYFAELNDILLKEGSSENTIQNIFPA
jgi:hypothetical protein